MNRRQLEAINAKIKTIFARSEKDEFLSFPPVGASIHEYGATELDLMAVMKEGNNVDETADIEKLCDFAKLVNQPPRGAFFNGDGDGEPLWSVYKEILSSAETTLDTLSPDEQKAYDEAVSFLFITEDDIITAYSKTYEIYNEYQDKYYDTLEKKGNVTLAITEWETMGNKTKVEAMLAIYNQLNTKYPSLFIANEQIHWDKNVRLQTALLSNQLFAPTYMFPTDVYKQEWNQVTINKDEIDRLVEGQSDVNEPEDCYTTKITFECRSVKVDRPWLNKDVMRSRNWRFRPSYNMQPIACEGNDLSVGRFPAYVTSLVLMRNIVIEQMTTSKEKKQETAKPAVTSGGRIDNPNTTKMQITEAEKRMQNDSSSIPRPSSVAPRQPHLSGTRPTTLGVGTTIVQSKSQKKVGTEGRMSIMAYICKRFPAPCPNPDPNANWIGGLNMAKLTLQQTAGGTLEAYIEGERVGSNSYQVGKTVTIKAIPDSSHVLDAWMVNSKKVALSEYELVQTISAEGLIVSAIWKTSKGSQQSDRFRISDDRKTLQKCMLTDSDIDLNEYAEMNGVTTIGPGAFEDNKTMHKIRISTQVKSIEDKAFAGCTNLQEVIIPAGLLNIAPSAFECKDSIRGPLFVVDSANESYAAFDGVLVSKEHVGKARLATCGKCGTTFFMPSDGAKLQTCPKCGVTLNSEREDIIVMPDFYIPFKANEVEARKNIQSDVKGKSFVLKEFVESVNKDFELHQVYVPYWSYDLTAECEWKAKIKRVKTEKVTNSDGTITQKENVSYEDKNGTVFKEFKDEAIPVSKLLKAENTDLSKQNKISPNGELWTSGAAFELYDMQPRQSLDQLKNNVDRNLRTEVDNQIMDTTESINISAIYKKLKQRLTMRPMWVGRIPFGETDYYVFADGVSGQANKNTTCAIDTKKRNKTYAIIAGVVVIALLILYLLFSQVFKKSNDTHTTSGVNTEHVVKSPSSGAPVTRPGTITRPSSSVSTRPQNGYGTSSSSSNNKETYKNELDYKENSSTGSTRRGGTRRR